MIKARGMIALSVAALLSQAATAHAAGTDPATQTDPIKPSSVMGDKDRSGPDGWVQAPVSRTRSPGQTAKAAGEPQTQAPDAAPASPKPMNPGDDPGTPVPSPVHGPGTTPGTGH